MSWATNAGAHDPQHLIRVIPAKGHEMRNDCIVIGAGVIGLSIAWRARQAGLSVIVLDSESRHGASRVAAGMLAPVTEASFGEEELLQLGLESARRYPGFLQELSDSSGRTLGHLAQGTLFVALDRDQLEALRRLYEFQVALGLEVRWLGREECRRREPLLHPSVRGGVLAADDREIDPRQLSAALMSVLETDAELRLSSEVAALVESGGSVTGVRLDDGEELSASAVVVAAGCWSGTIEGVPKEISESTRPVKG
ncbi:MAG: NAD(P)/FAD-dependent oxidoreductase, partial [Actinomycetota bacterium]